jgi:hypothetical protein
MNFIANLSKHRGKKLKTYKQQKRQQKGFLFNNSFKRNFCPKKQN